MNVSDRIRPNSEAAPWVIEWVKKLEAEVEQLHREVDSGAAHQRLLLRERDEALKALAVLVECSHGVSKGGCNCHRKAHAVLKKWSKP